jgi:ABC-type antimicrobial peptide transport system permease subunit
VHGELALTVRPSAEFIPAIATQSFLDAHNVGIGSTVTTTIGGVPAGVRIVGALAAFPTASPNGTLIVDLAAVQDLLVSNNASLAPTLSWWLATNSGQPPAGIAGPLPIGSSTFSRTATEQQLLTDPLSTVPQQALLGVGVAALLLASTGFCVSIAAGVRQRRAENALLAALGLAPRNAAAQLCLEKFMLSLPSAIAGVVLGTVLARLIVPAVTLSSTGTAPVPPVLIAFGWAPTLAAAALLAILPVLVAALVMVRRPDPAAALRAAEAA